MIFLQRFGRRDTSPRPLYVHASAFQRHPLALVIQDHARTRGVSILEGGGGSETVQPTQIVIVLVLQQPNEGCSNTLGKSSREKLTVMSADSSSVKIKIFTKALKSVPIPTHYVL